MLRIYIVNTILFSALISGCAVYDSRVAGTYMPSITNGLRGMVLVEMGGGLQDALPRMNKNCAAYGGLNQASVHRAVPEGGMAKFNAMSGNFWSYECNGFSQNSSPSPLISPPKSPVAAPSNEVTVPRESLEMVSKKCLELGFKKASEELLNCIEKLR